MAGLDNISSLWRKEIRSKKDLAKYRSNDNMIYRDAHVFNPATNYVVIPENIASEWYSELEAELQEVTTSWHRMASPAQCYITEQFKKLKKYNFEAPVPISCFYDTKFKCCEPKSVEEENSSPTNIFKDTKLESHASTSTGHADQVIKEYSEIYDLGRPFPLCYTEQSDSEPELTESEHSINKTKSAEEDNSTGTASNNTTEPSTSREESTAPNGSSESPPQSNIGEVQSNDRKLMNSRPSTKKAATYELGKFSKNAMLIINQEEVEGFSELRLGTDDDVKALKETFGNLGFETEDCYKDKTINEVLSILTEFSARDFTDYGCIAIAILTHGTTRGLLRAKDLKGVYGERTVLDYFSVSRNPTLLTKPIILIIQACRGDDDSKGYPTNTELKITKDVHCDPDKQYYLPLHCDILVLHSSFYGHPSFRLHRVGSWFIQTLCEKINILSPKLDLISIITEVQREVAIDKYYEEHKNETYEIVFNKQMPVMTSTLIRKLYFKNWQTEEGQLQIYDDDAVDIVCGNAIEHMCMEMHCSCFVEHFNYLKRCLSYFVKENPKVKNDPTALHLLEDANSIGKNYDGPKAKTILIAISYFLEKNASPFKYHKYLHFYKILDERSDSGRKYPIIRRLSQNYVPTIGAACIILSLLFLYNQIEEWFLYKSIFVYL